MSATMPVPTEELITQIRMLDMKFRRACDQILLLNNQIDDLQTRYNRAMKANRRSFRYSLRLQLATLEGVRNMFYEYASQRADELEGLQTQLIEAGGDPDDSADWEEVSEEDSHNASRHEAEDVTMESNDAENENSSSGSGDTATTPGD